MVKKYLESVSNYTFGKEGDSQRILSMVAVKLFDIVCIYVIANKYLKRGQEKKETKKEYPRKSTN